MIKKTIKIVSHLVKLNSTTKWLFVKTLFLSAFARFILLFIPFKKYRYLFGNQMQESTFEDKSDEITKALEIARMVQVICKHTLWDSKCLVKSLTGKWLLKQYGINSTIYLGVQKTPTNTLKAHAWLRVGNKVVIGDKIYANFKVVNYFS